jgi:hypothetical protein
MARSLQDPISHSGSVSARGSADSPVNGPRSALLRLNSLSVSERRAVLRAAASVLLERRENASRVGLSFDGKRDLYEALGYPDKLEPKDYFARYERGDIAERLIEAYPRAVWSGGASIIEDPDPDIETPFESAVVELFDRLGVWAKIQRAHICACLGRYSVLLLGADGDLATELPRFTTPNPNALITLTPLTEDRASVESFVDKTNDPRFNQPMFYRCRLSNVLTVKVHWTRVIHIAKGLLVDDVYGKPDLKSIWNRLMDLDKIVGGGAEATWKRQDPGTQAEMDPEVIEEMTDEEIKAEQEKVAEQWDEYLHGMRRLLYTSGVKLNPLSQTVQSFGPNAEFILRLVCGTKGIPYRIMTGSEMGELASSQDTDNWWARVTEERQDFGIPLVHRFLDRLIQYRFLPEPTQKEVIWPDVDELNESEKAEMISKLATANKDQHEAGQPVILATNEIRNTHLDLGPIEEVLEVKDENGEKKEEIDKEKETEAVVDSDDDEKSDPALRAAQAELRRIVLIGGPRRGKSTIARAYRDQGIPTFCSDPPSLVKDHEDNVEYLPEGLTWQESSQYVADNWLIQPGPWCVEGIAAARALRKVIASGKLDELEGVEVYVLERAQESAAVSPQQDAAAKGVMTVWNEIKDSFPNAQYLRPAQSRELISASRQRLRAAKASITQARSVNPRRHVRAFVRTI